MTKPDLKQYAAELAQLENAPPAAIELPPLAAIAIISHIQLATRHPSLADNAGLTKMAIEVALQLQALFSPESATYKVLELGWNSEEDRPLKQSPVLGHPVFDATKFDENYPLWNDPDDDDEYFPDGETGNYDGEAILDRYQHPEEFCYPDKP